MDAVGESVWVATDAGVYRSHDKGTTWARFGSESLYDDRVTRLAPGPDKTLWIHCAPNDPPSPTGFLTLTRDIGRSWDLLVTAVPGHANAVAEFDGVLYVGTADGLSAYDEVVPDLRRPRYGWLAWCRIAALAASTYRQDRLGWVSVEDPHSPHRPTCWLGSGGSGAVQRGLAVFDDAYRAWGPQGRTPLDVRRFSLFSRENVYALAVSEEAVWMGTEDGVIEYPRWGAWRQLRPSPGGLRAAPVRAIALRGNEAWLGTRNGLSVFDQSDRSWENFTEAGGRLPYNNVTALACDGDNVWGGTERGGFRVGADGTWENVLPEERVHDIALGYGRVYFATNRGVFALDETGRVRRQLNTRNCPALPDDRVLRVFVDGPEVWAATQIGVRRIVYDPAEPERPNPVRRSERTAEGVLVVINTNSEDSVRVGEGYAALREIPAENICRIACPEAETVNRVVYENDIRVPIWRHMRRHDLFRRISFVVTTRGVPLRVASGLPAQHRRDAPDTWREASVDSELTLLARSVDSAGWFPNPYLNREELFDSTRFGMYLVTRLDGPGVEAALDLAKQAIQAEENRAFGARGFMKLDFYPVEGEPFDELNAGIEDNYWVARRQNRLAGRIGKPERSRLPFEDPGDCLNTFFYLGLGVREYDPEVFSWLYGAIGVNLDPATATTLRDPEGSWAAGALAEGITGTIGMAHDAGSEPYLVVNGLYRYLMAGYTWAEAAYMCLPQLSWQGVVVGDPLYTPF